MPTSSLGDGVDKPLNRRRVVVVPWLTGSRTVGTLDFPPPAEPGALPARYISADQQLQLKGRVCAEIHSGHELLMTEIVFRGLLSQMPTGGIQVRECPCHPNPDEVRSETGGGMFC